MALPTCRGWAATGAMGGTNLYGQSGNSVAPILFGCIDFYSVTSDAFLDLLLPVSLTLVPLLQVECTYDINNEEGKITQGTIDIGGQGGVGQASYSKAMRAFAQCAEANMEAPGYCHGSLNSAETLRNGDVCQGGASVRRRYSLGLTALAALLRVTVNVCCADRHWLPHQDSD